MKEIWKDIPSFEGYYQVSNHGRIKALARTTFDKNGKAYSRKEHKALFTHKTMVLWYK